MLRRTATGRLGALQPPQSERAGAHLAGGHHPAATERSPIRDTVVFDTTKLGKYSRSPGQIVALRACASLVSQSMVMAANHGRRQTEHSSERMR